MNYLTYILAILLLPFAMVGQTNLVYNGSFELNSSCSSGTVGQRVTGWANFASTPDYFSACGNNVPTHFRGYQYAASGQAYIGLLDFNSLAANYGYRESILGTMTPMQVGILYEVSLSVAVSEMSACFTSGLCVHFFDTGQMTIPSFTGVSPITPKISFSSYGQLTDTQNWVRLTAYFLADSAYDHIAIGGFLDTGAFSHSPTYFTPPLVGGYNYWLIDSVVVRPAYQIVFSFNDSLCAGDSFDVDYIVSNHLQSNNVFSVQLSDKTGSFSNPVTIGTKYSDTSGFVRCGIPTTISNGLGYRLRIISSNAADTSDDNGYNIPIHNPDSITISTGTNSPLCEGSILQLFASTFTTGTTYAWTGPANFNSTSASPSIAGVSTVQNGDYIVNIKLYGCTMKDTLSVTINPLPAKPDAANNGPICAGDTLHLSISGTTTGAGYSWTGPGSYSSSIQNPSISNSSVAMSGDYIATANLNGCIATDTTTVLVKPLPAITTLTSNAPLCAGDTLYLSSTTSTAGATYNWTGPGNFSATAQNTYMANAAANATGWYKMLLSLNGCTYTDSTYAIIYPEPTMPNINYSSPLCVGETLNLGTTTVPGAIYNWRGPGNFSSAIQNPARINMQFGDTGSYTLTTTVNGCTSDTGKVSVVINPVPFVVIFPTPGDSICAGEQVTFTALPNNHGGTPAYRWYVNGLAAGTGISYTSSAINNLDVVRCDMTENTKCNAPYIDPSNDITMKVLPWLAPSVTITANPNRPLNVDEYVTFTATPTNGGVFPKYQWKRNGQDVQGATGPVWSANTLNDNDSISVELISNYRCPQPPTASSNGIRVKVLTGVSDVNENKKLRVYPNPAKDYVVFEYDAPVAKGDMQIRMYNAIGQKVDEIAVINETTTWNTGNLPAGVYIYRLVTENSIAETGRLIISR